MKLLWHSVAPWAPTGYGVQTGLFTPRIKALGHDIALSLYYGLQGAEMEWNGVRCLPSYYQRYGLDTIIPHALHHFGAQDDKSLAEASSKGMIIILGDSWTFGGVPLLDEFASAVWTPVDHLELPEVVRGFFGKTGAVAIAMSRFGEKALQDGGVPCVYVPHGIDTTIYRPGDKTQARESAGLPADAFIVGIVANNVGRDGNRKALAEQITAFAELRRKHADAFLMLHTDVDGPIGIRLRPFLTRMLPDGSYRFTDQYAYRKGLSPAAMAEIYRSADVLSNCAYGEGFGIPIIEAQACGTPVIVTDATAMPELCGAGWTVGYHKVWHDSQGANTAVPVVGEIADAYELAYRKADDGMRADAWAFAQDYDVDLVTEKYWKPVLGRFADALAKRAEEAAALAGRRERQAVIREADGLLWLDRGAQTGDALGFADHEAQNGRILDSLLPEGGVFLDVGAHVGHWALRLARKASRVIAVEANPATAATLRRHIAMNGITNIKVVEQAAWDKDEALVMSDPTGQAEGGSARVLPADGQQAEAHGKRLDEVLEWEDRIDLVKLDVEGADLHALRGMKDLLDRTRPVLFVECHDVYGYYKREDLEQTLTELGYTWEVASSAMTDWMPDGPTGEMKQCDWLTCRPLN